MEYYTPVGMVSTAAVYTDEMRKAGASLVGIEEHVIKNPKAIALLATSLNILNESRISMTLLHGKMG